MDNENALEIVELITSRFERSFVYTKRGVTGNVDVDVDVGVIRSSLKRYHRLG